MKTYFFVFYCFLILFNDDDIRLFRSLKSNSLVMNAIIIPNVVDKMNDCIQFNELFFRIKHVMLVNAINDIMLIHSWLPNFKLNVLLAIINWIKQVANCTHKLVNAAP